MQELKFDIIILGGGIVGLTTALLCAKQNFKVALVETKEPEVGLKKTNIETEITKEPDFAKKNTVGLKESDIEFHERDKNFSKYDYRVSAMSKASIEIFKSINVWDEMVSDRISSYQKMSVFDALGFGEIHFSANEINEANLGYIIENSVMMKALWKAVDQSDTIKLFTSAETIACYYPSAENISCTYPMAETIACTYPLDDKVYQKTPSHSHQNVKNIPNETNIIKLEIKIRQNPYSLQAKVVVGADGANSWLRNSLNLATEKKDYEQMALVATVQTALPHEKTAWQRFLSLGPLAFLPLNHPNTSSIVWTMPKGLAKENLQSDEDTFCKALAHAFDYRLGTVSSVENRHIFPLKMLYAKEGITERAVLIGDALHVIHPLAGQGVNLGLLDAKVLAELFVRARDEARDIGQRRTLRQFERARKEHILVMLSLVEFCKQIFSREESIITTLRSIGLNFINKRHGFKKLLIHHAMGLPYLLD